MGIPEPELDAPERRAFALGVDQFNRGYFFECHDTLEELWSGLRGQPRDFFQALIQVAVGFYHLSNGNRVGAESMFSRALKRFEKYPGRYFGFDLAGYRAEIGRWQERMAAGEVPPLPPGEAPAWRFD